ncbi:MAG: hypothetical protein HC871_16320, partial [Rhizobiales bacterium]|nr:hypothetical protein [Hyphomicrobiales bacterium]
MISQESPGTASCRLGGTRFGHSSLFLLLWFLSSALVAAVAVGLTWHAATHLLRNEVQADARAWIDHLTRRVPDLDRMLATGVVSLQDQKLLRATALPPLDVAINVASLQEMPAATVEAYLALIDAGARPGGIVFLENSRDFLQPREYRYPGRWRYLVKEHSPRSRSLDYPVDILQVTGADQSAANKEVVERYYASLKDRARELIDAQK